MSSGLERLTAALTAALGRDIEKLTPLTGGASRATYAFDALGSPDGAATESLILRVDRGGSTTGSTLSLEARSIAAVSGSVPVPRIVASGDGGEGDLVGSPWVVMERVEGETIPRKILRDEDFAHARSVLARDCAEALASIHHLDGSTIDGLDDSDPLATWSAVLHSLTGPHPALEIGERWLSANRPEPSGHTLVHGDFRLGNLLVGPDGLRAVLDWELVHRGDPVEDLGWMCVRAWRFGSPLPALGLASYDELLDAYEAASGRRVDPAALAWWETCGTWRWGVMCSMMAQTAKAAGRLTVEPAAIGRRSCENEWDLMRCLQRAGLEPTPLLEPTEAGSRGLADDNALEPTTPSLHDAPSVAELVAAVRSFVADDVQPATAGSVSYHARVAANVLGMVERELREGDRQRATHARLLESLGVSDDEELASAIRDGRLAYDDPAVLAVVDWEVSEKLLVAHPDYVQDRPAPSV